MIYKTPHPIKVKRCKSHGNCWKDMANFGQIFFFKAEAKGHPISFMKRSVGTCLQNGVKEIHTAKI